MGFGIKRRIMCAFWSAYTHGMALAPHPHGSWLYTNTNDCPKKNNECYFQKLMSPKTHQHVFRTVHHEVRCPIFRTRI